MTKLLKVMPSTSIYSIRPNSASNLSTGSSVIEDVIKEEEEEDLDDEDDYDGDKAYMSMSEAADIRVTTTTMVTKWIHKNCMKGLLRQPLKMMWTVCFYCLKCMQMKLI